MSNYELMNYFINYIKEIVVSNQDFTLTPNFVYSNLMVFNVEQERNPLESTKFMFESFKNDFNYNNAGIKVFESERMRHFLFFTHGKMKGNEIKLYIPLDMNHLKIAGEEIFKFIEGLGIEHQSKIADIIRNDDLVIRVNNLEDADKIIRFVTGNNYIKEGMLKVNPFLPSIGKVGITMDNNYSYNMTVCNLITDFINYLKQINRLDCANIYEFNNYIKYANKEITDLDLKDIYNLLEQVTTPNFKIEDFINHAQNKLCDKYTNDRQRITNPSIYFESAIKETSVVHPQNVRVAIINYLHNNPMYFTNNNRARNSLVKYVKPGDVINIMRSKLTSNNIPIPQSDQELITSYLNLVLDNQNNYLKSFNIIKNAYQNTIEEYNLFQATTALKELIIHKNIMYFTNKYKDREILNTILDHDIKKIILSNIDITNLDINNIDEIINRFVEVINYDKSYMKSSNIN